MPLSTSAALLERFPKHISLGLRPAYFDLLRKLGDPQRKLPPVFHVAGTNGKGSVCAFLRAMLEAAGKRVHVYTSPHLVQFHERIRIAGALIGEEELCALLEECLHVGEPGSISVFEAATAAALAVFVRHPADFTILEVGLGGRLDATNVVEKPLATVITRLSIDHREFLGDTATLIAREKAGIMRAGVPCFTAPQPDTDALAALRESADAAGASLRVGGEDWFVDERTDGFRYRDPARAFDLPLPALAGRHQFENAGLAIAALTQSVQDENLRANFGKIISAAMHNVEWPARLQKLSVGALAELLPRVWELWLDGGHNDSAGEVLAQQAQAWRLADSRPLHLVCGMLGSKNPRVFLSPLAPFVHSLHAVAIPDEANSHAASSIAENARGSGIFSVSVAANVMEALTQITQHATAPGRILICGSLYLAGHVLRVNAESSAEFGRKKTGTGI